MKKIIAVILVLLVFQKWDAINAYFNPPPSYAHLHPDKVILYATAWCGYCKAAREFMDKNNIAYHEYDIEKSTEGKKQYDSLGVRGVPVMLINDQIVHGYNPEKIMQLANNE